MTIQIGAYEAKTHLSQLLERAQQGERIIITRHGTPIAELGPVEGEQQMSIDEAIDALKAFRQRHRLDGLSIREMVEEGRM